MILGQVINHNFDRLLRLCWKYLLMIYVNFIQMPHKEKDLNITILETYTNATQDQVQMDIKTVWTKYWKISSRLSKKSFVWFNSIRKSHLNFAPVVSSYFFYLRLFLFFLCFNFISIHYHTQIKQKNKN